MWVKFVTYDLQDYIENEYYEFKEYGEVCLNVSHIESIVAVTDSICVVNVSGLEYMIKVSENKLFHYLGNPIIFNSMVTTSS